MSVLSKLFGGVQAQPQPMSQAQAMNPANPQQQATPGNIPVTNANPASETNPTVPANSVIETPTPEGLDKFSDIWNIKPEDMPKAPTSAFAGVTPEAIKAVAGKTDFSKVVTPEMMTAISSGGEPAAAAMLTALNAVAQQTYATSAEATIKLIDTALAKQREQFQVELPSLIKNQNVTESLRNSNPIFNHTAAQPMLQMLQNQLQLKNPTASAEQVRQKAEEFLTSFAQAASPQKQQANASAPKGEDWDSWEL